MNDKLQFIFRQLLITLGPFIMIGITIAFIIGLIILSWYVLLWGLMIGLFLWACAFVKRYFFAVRPSETKHKGQIIDHEKQK